MPQLSDTGLQAVASIAARHGFSTEAVTVMLQAVQAGGGTMAQFRHRSNDPDAMINWEKYRRPQTLVLADWVFETCYLGKPIALRYWREGELVWAGEPDYAREK